MDNYVIRREKKGETRNVNNIICDCFCSVPDIADLRLAPRFYFFFISFCFICYFVIDIRIVLRFVCGVTFIFVVVYFSFFLYLGDSTIGDDKHSRAHLFRRLDNSIFNSSGSSIHTAHQTHTSILVRSNWKTRARRFFIRCRCDFKIGFLSIAQWPKRLRS